MPKDQANKPEKDKDIRNNSHESFDETANDIIKAFVDKKQKESSSYFPLKKKNAIVDDFKEYVRRNYGEWILKKLLASGKLDVEFNQVIDKWFTIEDFLNPEKNKAIKEQFWDILSEQEALSALTLDCYKQRNLLSQTEKDTMKFDDFLREVWYTAQTDPDGTIQSIQVSPKAKVTTVVDLKSTWNRFAQRSTTNSEVAQNYADMMDIGRFDPSEKIACITATKSLYSKINDLPSSKRDAILALREDRFGSASDAIPVSALEKRTTLDGLQACLNDFFADVAYTGQLTQKELTDLQSISINPKSCIAYGRKSWEISQEDAVVQGKKFSQLNSTIQSLTDKLVTSDMITNVDDHINKVDTSIDQFVKVFDMPGSMKGFFSQFPVDAVVNNLSPDKKREIAELKYQQEQLREQAAYQKEKWASRADMEVLHQQIFDLQRQLADLQYRDHHVASSWTEYYNSIAESTVEHSLLINKPIDQSTISAIPSILQKLQEAKRDTTVLSSNEQNILMKVSVLAQLAKVKESDIMTDLSYNFEEYAQFVSELFDIKSTKSVIVTKDQYPIELNFTQPNGKRFVGKPYDRQTITLNDLNDLSQLRIEFEIDLNTDTTGQTELFLKAITWGHQSKIIKDLPFSAPGFPKTITDSTKVRLIGKDGKQYEWYLSPVALDIPWGDHSDEHDDEGNITAAAAQRAKNYATAFALYDKPVDQYHSDRKALTYENIDNPDTTQVWQNPIYIGADNYHQFQQMDIVDKKVTLSGQSINNLALWHILAQENDLDRITLDKAESAFTDLEQKLVASSNKDQRDIDLWSSSEKQSSEIVDDDHAQLVSWWNKLFPRIQSDKMPPISEGQRFVLSPKWAIWPSSVPKHREYLSCTISKLHSKNGKTVWFDIDIDNLTVGVSRLKTKTLTIDTWNISSLSDPSKFETGFTKYLYNVSETDIHNFDLVRGKLAEKFSKKEDSSMLWAPLQELTMSDTWVFQKWGKEVTKFVAPHVASSGKKLGNGETDNQKHDVEYTVTYNKVSKDYHIASTWYAIDQVSDTWEKKKEVTYFETTTDLTGLLLLIANKKLKPRTSEEMEYGTENNVIPTTRPKNRRSIGRVRDFLKDGGSSMVEARKKKREDSSKKDFEYMMFHEYNIYRRLQSRFGGILEHFDMDFLDDLADEKDANAMTYGREKIEWDYNQINKFHHSYNVNIFWEWESGHKGANAMCESRMEAAMESYDNNNGDVPYKQRYKVAAALLYMIEKYKNGTARLMQRYPRGSYVKILFGAPAYKIFMEKYEEKKSLLENSKYGNKIQQDLVLFEYNFICSNISWWGQQDERVRDQDYDDNQWWWNAAKNPNAWYFQRLYSRKYGNELRTRIGQIKSISPSPSNEKVKEMVEWNTFDHMKNEYYNHIGQYRMEDAVWELVAMQQLASTQEEANEVFVAVMLGILNGAFINNLGMETRDALRRTCRNSGIPFPNWMEHYDAQYKIQRLLNLCTADLGSKSFQKFTYTRKDPKTGEVIEPNVSYHPSKFWPLQREPGDTGGLGGAFRERLAPGTEARTRVINFLTMDNIDDGGDENNMMNIRKSPDDKPPIIYGRETDKQDKEIVRSMIKELYFNKDRWQDLWELNWAYWYNPSSDGYIGGAHTRTMIEPAFGLFNVLESDGSFKLWVWDHAEWIWESILHRIPSKKLNPSTQKYKMAFFVDEFFRCFKQVGKLQYDKNVIEKFYRYMRIAKERNLSPHDRKRLIRFYLTQQAYANWSIPPVIERALAKYIAFFDDNLELFDAKLADMHYIPGAWWWQETFSYVFTEDNSTQIYYPDAEWQKKDKAARDKEYRQETWNLRTLINGEMENANKRANAINEYGNSAGYIWSTIDAKIDDLRKKAWMSGTSGGWSPDHTNKRTWLQSRIRATNNDLVDRSKVEQQSSLGVDKDGKLVKHTADNVKSTTADWSTNSPLQPWWDIAYPWWIPKERLEVAKKAWAEAWEKKGEETAYSIMG